MKKTKVATLAAGAALLAVAGMAQAAPMEYNIFGASAQFDYWKAAAPNYLSQKLGCTAGTVYFTGKHGFVQGTDCTSTLIPVESGNTTAGSNRNIDFRFSGIASGEFAAVGGTQTNNTTISCASGFERKMKEFADATTSLVCKKVHLGASDLDPSSFTQSTTGQLYGPRGGGSYTNTLNGISTTGMTKAGEAFAVPFGLFVNTAVTAKHCTAGNVGDICATAADCGTGGACSATSSTIKNLSRLQTAMVFSGQVASWADFGPAYDDKQVVACLRHAGSGTAATFDKMVMSAGGTGWGAVLPDAEAVNLPGEGPVIWFNEGTDDVMKCVNGNSTTDADGDNTIAAVGYADADKGIGVAATSQNVVKIKYDGQWPYASNINQGVYDWYSVATLWTHSSNTAQNAITNNATVGLIPFVKQAANIPSSKAQYWVATATMLFKRGSDLVYPTRQ